MELICFPDHILQLGRNLGGAKMIIVMCCGPKSTTPHHLFLPDWEVSADNKKELLLCPGQGIALFLPKFLGIKFK